MLQEIPLIIKKQTQYQICNKGLILLRTLKTKKLRIILNITHEQNRLDTFNGWLFGIEQKYLTQNLKENTCLTISKFSRELEQQRVILILNAYEDPTSEPFMVLLGYLASSVFLYHHFSCKLSAESPLTSMLRKLRQHLAVTDINDLTREMKFKKGYSKNPHFLCLLQASSAKEETDPFKQFYRYSEGGDEAFNQAIDALIDFLPERSSIALSMSKEQVSKIGKQFEENVLGRQIFNFQFTGSTLQNLCFECCQAFNHSKPLNLNLVYSKIIQNQKCRLEDEATQRYFNKISATFFNGGKIDFQGTNKFPVNSSYLIRKHNEIAQEILQETIKLASYCMNLAEFKNINQSLRQKFNKTLSQMVNINNQKNQQFCRQCYELLQNVDLCAINSSTLSDLFRQISNKFQLFTSECSEAIGRDTSFKTFTNYLNRLQSTILEKLSSSAVQAFQANQLKIQEQKVEKQDLRYNIRVFENKLREIHYQYNLQEDILNQYKMKLFHQPQPVAQQTYSSELNKYRKRVQQLEQEVKDKNLFIEQLEGIIERFQGLAPRDRLKYKFSKEIVQMIKQVSNEVNNCHAFIKEAKKTNEFYEEIKEGFSKQRQSIVEERKKALQDINTKQAEFQKIIKEKTYLQQVIHEARQSIQVYKQVDQSYKDSISNLQNTYTQAQCLLAQTQNQLELFKKALSLISQQQSKGGKIDALNKFYKVSTNPDLRELLKPFLKK